MHASERVCQRNYYHQTNNSSPLSPMNNLSSSKGAMDNTSYLNCTERLTCNGEMSSKATFYCPQCNSLQCISCEKKIHQQSENSKHERVNLDEMDDEYCSIDRQNPAVFYCPACALSFCYACYEDKHQHTDGREHKPQKCREGPMLTSKKNT